MQVFKTRDESLGLSPRTGIGIFGLNLSSDHQPAPGKRILRNLGLSLKRRDGWLTPIRFLQTLGLWQHIF